VLLTRTTNMKVNFAIVPYIMEVCRDVEVVFRILMY